MAITFMTITCRQEVREAFRFSRDWTKRQLAIAVAMYFVLGAGTALAGGDSGFCSRTAKAVFRACQSEVRDDFFIAKATCISVSDDVERAQCFADARASRRESKELCREQRTGRLDACKSLGEGRYDPDFDPANFDDPRNPTNPNPYFPLGIGNQWEYRGGAETNTVQVLNQTKAIAGVTCIVVRDKVFNDGDLAESTDDWFAPAKDGTVWYCGEEVKNFESFEGDDPRRPELVSIDGSFKAGRDGDKPGIIFQASPTPGQVYLEEFSLGNAEDVTEVLSTTYAFGSNPELDQFVPEPLAERFCSGDCVVTSNFSPLEPGVFARKYYAPGIGVFLEVNPTTGDVVQLVECNFDPRCADLPTP
ncbi:MAG: hypothetical protein M3361_20700 [Candidatus Tectomicrobia bacterium]|nr:hypothetical protein [Candidatus Tectomicrobia bacterium]